MGAWVIALSEEASYESYTEGRIYIDVVWCALAFGLQGYRLIVNKD